MKYWSWREEQGVFGAGSSYESPGSTWDPRSPAGNDKPTEKEQDTF